MSLPFGFNFFLSGFKSIRLVLEDKMKPQFIDMCSCEDCIFKQTEIDFSGLCECRKEIMLALVLHLHLPVIQVVLSCVSTQQSPRVSPHKLTGIRLVLLLNAPVGLHIAQEEDSVGAVKIKLNSS